MRIEHSDAQLTFKPKYVFHLAARVGGVKANYDYLADFYDDNILINTNVFKEDVSQEIVVFKGDKN